MMKYNVASHTRHKIDYNWGKRVNHKHQSEGQSMVEDKKKNKDSEEIQTDDLVVHYWSVGMHATIKGLL